MSPAFEEFCQTHLGQTLSQIYESFQTMDVYSALAQKEKALIYLEAQDFNRVVYEHFRVRDTEVSW